MVSIGRGRPGCCRTDRGGNIVIVLAVTEGVASRACWLADGIAPGIAGASVVAVSTAALSDAFEGAGQEVLTAAIPGFGDFHRDTTHGVMAAK